MLLKRLGLEVQALNFEKSVGSSVFKANALNMIINPGLAVPISSSAKVSLNYRYRLLGSADDEEDIFAEDSNRGFALSFQYDI